MTTQAERLARIETLVEGIANGMEKAEAERIRVHTELRAEITKLREDLHADKAELAALKNKGTGLLVGVGLAGGTIGAALTSAWSALFGS